MTGLLTRLMLLAALIGGLGLGVKGAWPLLRETPVAVPAAEAPTRAAGVPAAPQPFTRPALSAFPETLRQPLFFEGRKYPERKAPVAAPIAPVIAASPSAPPAVKAPPPQPMAPPPTTAGIKLLGTMVTRGQARALIEAGNAGGEWVGVGARVGEWTIEAIGADRVALRQGRQSATLELHTISTGSPQSRGR